jgi:hypothetical protein
LRIAAANAGLTTSTTEPGHAIMNRHMTLSALAAPTPLAIATPAAAIYNNKQATMSRGDAVVVNLGDSASVSSREMFPLRLHALLADPTVRDVISWLPHGKSFVVLRPDVFASRVLPRYFAPEGANNQGHRHRAADTAAVDPNAHPSTTEGAHKYPSFTRKLNRWGFRQVSRGSDAGAFCHDLFQRDDATLCRGMICQKSRKSFSSESSSRIDDVMSVSSGSTMGTVVGNRSVASFGNGHTGASTKRLYSSTVTVSTAGQTNNNNSGHARDVTISNKSLPFKKRKSTGQYVAMMSDIPSMISHGYQKMSSGSSMTESDLTSDNGSVSSNGNKNTEFAVLKVPPTTNVAPFGSNNPVHAAEALAREALARHFHEQHRAFALASLLENSRLAIEAAGMSATNKDQQDSSGRPKPPPFATAVAVPQSSLLSAAREPKMTQSAVQVAPAAAVTSSVLSAEVARAALYKAYLQAMNCDNASAMALPSSSVEAPATSS